MGIEFRRGGRKVSQKDFLRGITEDVLARAMDAGVEKLHGQMASVVDPETGKHAPVFVRKIGTQGWIIQTSGSPAYARALEQRLGLNQGDVQVINESEKREARVYLAHAHEDKAIVEPIARGLMQRGIDVWYDTWEIGYGDSLRRKMEAGLGDCTHFIVLLTETSMTKSWVNEEIDIGLMNAVEGTAKFIGLRHQLPIGAVSPFLQTRLTPELKPGEEGLDALAGEIFGLSKKPPLGETPRYVQAHVPGSTWSAAARGVAEFFVRHSEFGHPVDPQTTYAEIHQATGLPMPDVRVGVLDLVGAGLLEKRDYMGGEAVIWPKTDLFTTFDGDFMPWNPQRDAGDLATYLLNLEVPQVQTADVFPALGWEPRRFNAAAAYLLAARAVEAIEWNDSAEYWPAAFILGDALLRFVRNL
jgi:TIR domain